MVLSHGHYDHFGGMVGFLNATKGKLKSDIPFYVGGEDCFCIRRQPFGNLNLAPPDQRGRTFMRPR
jgi:7,8-dihydropterin-6-yl-methyl-4-(beta-D-ribofuranosyl)aminobenzene 5'-phosphate synthase